MNSITRRLIKKTFSSQTATTAVNGPLKLFCIIKALAAKLVFDYDLSLHLHFSSLADTSKKNVPMNTWHLLCMSELLPLKVAKKKKTH